MAHNQLSARTPKPGIGPLGIIAVFVGLVDTVTTVGLTQTHDGVQVALTCFVIGYPILVFAALIYTLYRQPGILYPPSEYSAGTDVATYVASVRGLGSSESHLYERIEGIVTKQLAAPELIQKLKGVGADSSPTAAQADIASILTTAATRTVEQIRDVGFLTIDSRPLEGDGGREAQLPYEQFATVGSLLDAVWLGFVRSVPAWTYNKRWALRDAQSGHCFTDLQSRKVQGRTKDARSLAEVGIHPGMTLEAVPLEECQA